MTSKTRVMRLSPWGRTLLTSMLISGQGFVVAEKFVTGGPEDLGIRSTIFYSLLMSGVCPIVKNLNKAIHNKSMHSTTTFFLHSIREPPGYSLHTSRGGKVEEITQDRSEWWSLCWDYKPSVVTRSTSSSCQSKYRSFTYSCTLAVSAQDPPPGHNCRCQCTPA